MNFEVLLSCMYQNDYSILESINLNSNAVVVNQCNLEKVTELNFRNHRVLWIDTTDRGISKSRNKLIKNSTADVCLLVDDDEILLPNCESIILDSFKNKKVSLIRFQVHGIENKHNDYSSKEKRINLLESMKVSSVEIAFLRKDIIENNLFFDELIGAGTKFNSGEENSFLFHCILKKLNLYYLPIKIADLHMQESTWFDGFNEKYFIGKGAAFTSMNNFLSNLLIFQFAVRKYKLYSKNLTFIEVFKLMHKGKNEYLKINKSIMEE